MYCTYISELNLGEKEAPRRLKSNQVKVGAEEGRTKKKPKTQQAGGDKRGSGPDNVTEKRITSFCLKNKNQWDYLSVYNLEQLTEEGKNHRRSSKILYMYNGRLMDSELYLRHSL
jgi:hypothetical protein